MAAVEWQSRTSRSALTRSWSTFSPERGPIALKVLYASGHWQQPSCTTTTTPALVVWRHCARGRCFVLLSSRHRLLAPPPDSSYRLLIPPPYPQSTVPSPWLLSSVPRSVRTCAPALRHAPRAGWPPAGHPPLLVAPLLPRPRPVRYCACRRQRTRLRRVRRRWHPPGRPAAVVARRRP